MIDLIGFVLVAFIMINLTYRLVRQIQYIVTIQKRNNIDITNYKRTLFGNYLAGGLLLGFLISFILNVLVAMQIIQSSLIRSDNTALSCFIFLLVFVLTKSLIIPKNRNQHKILKG